MKRWNFVVDETVIPSSWNPFRPQLYTLHQLVRPIIRVSNPSLFSTHTRVRCHEYPHSIKSGNVNLGRIISLICLFSLSHRIIEQRSSSSSSSFPRITIQLPSNETEISSSIFSPHHHHHSVFVPMYRIHATLHASAFIPPFSLESDKLTPAHWHHRRAASTHHPFGFFLLSSDLYDVFDIDSTLGNRSLKK